MLKAHTGRLIRVTDQLTMVDMEVPTYMKREAFYVHDCTQCVLVGQAHGEDVYVCEKQNFIEVVMRWGNDGPEYRSMVYFKRKQL